MKYKFYACVHGYYEGSVEADSFEEAKEKFDNMVSEADFGDLIDIEWETYEQQD